MQSRSHDKRSAELARRLSARLAVPQAEVAEVCSDFDNAVEFAALEGKSIAEAIQEFLADGDGVFFDELARMIGDGAGSFDFTDIRLLVMPKEFSALSGNVAVELRTVGRAGFARMPDLFRKREQSWLEAGFPAAYAATLAYGMDQAECGARILRAWGFGEEISAGNPVARDVNRNIATARGTLAVNVIAIDLFNTGKAA